jgi:hypothetical protein
MLEARHRRPSRLDLWSRLIQTSLALGKAMTALKQGKGLVLALVTLQ